MDAVVQAVLVWLSKHVAQEQRVITSAPVAFAVCVGLASTVMLFILRWHFKHELSARDGTIRIHEERHKLKDEKMAEFLARTERASPDQLATQIAALRADVESQKRRILTAQQREALIAAFGADAKEHSEPLIFGIWYNKWDGEAEEYARQLASVFSQLGASGALGSTDDASRQCPLRCWN